MRTTVVLVARTVTYTYIEVYAGDSWTHRKETYAAWNACYAIS